LPDALDAGKFLAELRKLRGRGKPLSPPALKVLRDSYSQSVQPLRELSTEAASLEQQVSDLVNLAFGVSPQDTKLIWQTASPKMSIPALRF
jgi:hypothetical protein